MRAAASGTMPPIAACGSICVWLLSANSSRPARTNATEVSSQEVSIAATSGPSETVTGAWSN